MNTELEVALKDIEIIAAYLGKTDMTEIIKLDLNLLLKLRSKYYDGANFDASDELALWSSMANILSELGTDLAHIKQYIGLSPNFAFGKKQLYKKILQQHMKVFGISACLWVFFILIVQSYYLIGNDVVSKNNVLFKQRNDMKIDLLKKTNLLKRMQVSINENIDYHTINNSIELLDEQFDANREILMQWNLIWRFGIPFTPKFSIYDNAVYYEKQENAKNQLIKSNLILEWSLKESRNIYFLNNISAKYILSLIEDYILPILYGSLGAFIKVLRDIYQQYNSHNLIKRSYWYCNLQIFLGGIAAMSSKLIFFETLVISDNNHMTFFFLAFLVGYNLDSFFNYLENMLNKIIKK